MKVLEKILTYIGLGLLLFYFFYCLPELFIVVGVLMLADMIKDYIKNEKWREHYERS